MTKKFLITAKMLEELDYDAPKGDTKLDMIGTDTSKFYFQKYKLPSISSNTVLQTITDKLDVLSEIENQENWIPLTLARQHIEQGLKYGKCDPEKPKLLDPIKSFAPVLDVRHHVCLVEVVHNLFLLAQSQCGQVIFCWDERRKGFLTKLCSALEFKEDKLDDHINVKDLKERYMKIHFPYTSMFIFDSGDIESATYRLASSLYDPLAPWRVRCVYVQESCYENFCNRLVDKLRPYPKEIRDDRNFNLSYTEGLEKIKKFNAKLLKCFSSNECIPLICHDFNRDYFETKSYLSPVVILKQFRTAKEALALAKFDNGGLASVWSENISTAFDLAGKLASNVVWINCFGMLNPSIPMSVRQNTNCLGGKYAFLDFFAAYFPVLKDSTKKELMPFKNCISNGWKLEGSYHYQYSAKVNAKKDQAQIVKSLLVCGEKYINVDNLMDFTENPFWQTAYEIVRRRKPLSEFQLLDKLAEPKKRYEFMRDPFKISKAAQMYEATERITNLCGFRLARLQQNKN